MEARLALTLRMVGGLTMPEIARAFLVTESAMGQDHPREGQDQGGSHPLSRAVRRGSPARVSGVLAVLFLVFNEGYLATGPETDPYVTTDRRGDPPHPPDPYPPAGRWRQPGCWR